MNREELERMFDKKFKIQGNNFNFICWKKSLPDEIKDFIFNTIIQEVLSSMLVYEGTGTDPIIVKRKYCNEIIKQKAKAIYNITI